MDWTGRKNKNHRYLQNICTSKFQFYWYPSGDPKIYNWPLPETFGLGHNLFWANVSLTRGKSSYCSDYYVIKMPLKRKNMKTVIVLWWDLLSISRCCFSCTAESWAKLCQNFKKTALFQRCLLLQKCLTNQM